MRTLIIFTLLFAGCAFDLSSLGPKDGGEEGDSDTWNQDSGFPDSDSSMEDAGTEDSSVADSGNQETDSSVDAGVDSGNLPDTGVDSSTDSGIFPVDAEVDSGICPDGVLCGGRLCGGVSCGTYCHEDRCVTCADDLQCAGSMVCVDNACVPCRTNADCAAIDPFYPYCRANHYCYSSP